MPGNNTGVCIVNKQMLLSSSGICASLRNTLATMAALFALAGCASVEQTYRMATSFNLQEATIASVQEAIATRQLTCVQLTRMYLERIAAYDRQGPTLRAIITVNPKAMEQAAEMDRQYWANPASRPPLHCTPLILKDNFDTFDMPTTGGNVSMKSSVPLKIGRAHV